MKFAQITELAAAARDLVALSQKAPSNTHPEKAGGYLVIGSRGFEERYILKIGTCPAEKEDKYRNLAQEKAHRLFSDWLRDPLTISSWQTREPKLDRWGGAVSFPIIGERSPSCDIISFSGLIEPADEALGLMLGYQFNLATDPSFAERVISISANKVYREMMQR